MHFCKDCILLHSIVILCPSDDAALGASRFAGKRINLSEWERGRQLTLDQMFPWTTTTLPPWWWSWLWWSCWWRSPWVAKTRLLGHQMPLLMSLWAACHSQTIIHTTITTITIGIYSVCHHHHLLPNFRLTSSSPLDTSFWVGRISHLGHQMDPVSMSHNVTQSHHTIHKRTRKMENKTTQCSNIKWSVQSSAKFKQERTVRNYVQQKSFSYIAFVLSGGNCIEVQCILLCTLRAQCLEEVYQVFGAFRKQLGSKNANWCQGGEATTAPKTSTRREIYFQIWTKWFQNQEVQG